MNTYHLIAVSIEIFHLVVILFFIWGIGISFRSKYTQKKYETLLRIHFILLIYLLPVQIICCGCPLTAISNQFMIMAHPEKKHSFINGGFIAKICHDYLGFTPSGTIITIITILIIMIYLGNRLWLKQKKDWAGLLPALSPSSVLPYFIVLAISTPLHSHDFKSPSIYSPKEIRCSEIKCFLSAFIILLIWRLRHWVKVIVIITHNWGFISWSRWSQYSRSTRSPWNSRWWCVSRQWRGINIGSISLPCSFTRIPFRHCCNCKDVNGVSIISW